MPRTPPEPRTAYEAEMLAAIREDGWWCKRVGGGAPLAGERPLGTDPAWDPPFAYTVGPSLQGDPELVLVGEWRDDCRILATIVVDLLGGGRRFAAGDLSEEVFVGVPVRFGAVSDERRRQLLTSADFLNDGAPFEALQVVIPDARGAWPEDPAYDGTPQPLLGT